MSYRCQSYHIKKTGPGQPLDVITISDSDDDVAPEQLDVDLDISKSADLVASSGPTLGCSSLMTVTPVAQGAITLSGSPGGSYLVGPGGSAVSTPRERQSVASTAELVRLDREVREAAVEVPPQKIPIKVEPSYRVTPGMSQKKRLLAKAQ